ncbi:MAG: GNAT family N-acetyltransferase [Oscillospiraceae bacterium]|nr:GNAT family N-acetyltransferase [Oscillospiraceae bacterium]
MDISDVYCEALTKENAYLMDAVLDELGIDPKRLRGFLEHPQNLAFIAKYHDEACGFIYGYSLMSLTAAPQLFVYSVDVLSLFQNSGIGSKLFQYVVDYSKENGYSECFVITDKGNKRACRVYEKAGGKNDFEDEIVYVINLRTLR